MAGRAMRVAAAVLLGVFFSSSVLLSSSAVAQPAAPSRAGAFNAQSISAYEWQDALWSTSTSTYTTRLTLLKKLGVTVLFVDITRAVTYMGSHSTRLLPYLTTFRLLVSKAAREGIEVQALMGDPDWATSYLAGPADALAVLSKLRGLSAGEMPAGFQFDVEPWGLPAWHSHEAAYALDFAEMVQRVVAGWKLARLPGSLGFAVPFWWNGIEGVVPDINPGSGPQNPLHAVLGALAAVPNAYLNVMTYCTKATSPGGTVSMFDSDLAVERSMRSRVTLLLGQEVAHDPAGPSVSFDGASWHTWAANVATLRSHFASAPHFGGLAVEDAQGLIALRAG